VPHAEINRTVPKRYAQVTHAELNVMIGRINDYVTDKRFQAFDPHGLNPKPLTLNPELNRYQAVDPQGLGSRVSGLGSRGFRVWVTDDKSRDDVCVDIFEAVTCLYT
jgi:hypothetical protein